MKNLLEQISKQSILLGDFSFTDEEINSEWIGNKPCEQSEIDNLEKRLNLCLPSDYKEFLSLTNGFKCGIGTEPTFLQISEIQYLNNIDPELIEIWDTPELNNVANFLKTSIVIGGIDEDQLFLLIPPNQNFDDWKYWKFANWIPGEEEYESLKDYFENYLIFMQDMNSQN